MTIPKTKEGDSFHEKIKGRGRAAVYQGPPELLGGQDGGRNQAQPGRRRRIHEPGRADDQPALPGGLCRRLAPRCRSYKDWLPEEKDSKGPGIIAHNPGRLGAPGGAPAEEGKGGDMRERGKEDFGFLAAAALLSALVLGGAYHAVRAISAEKEIAVLERARSYMAEAAGFQRRLSELEDRLAEKIEGADGLFSIEGRTFEGIASQIGRAHR